MSLYFSLFLVHVHVCVYVQEAQKEIGDGKGCRCQEMARRHPATYVLGEAWMRVIDSLSAAY